MMNVLLLLIAVLFTFESFGQGNGWEPQSSGTTSLLKAVHFSDTLHGWAIGDHTLLRTSNGGQNWDSIPQPGWAFIGSVFFANPDLGWLVGDSGKALKTTDGGNTWQKLTSGVSVALGGVRFFDAQTGWITGAQGTVLKTTNGGATWTAQTTGVSVYLDKLNIIDSQSIWVTGEDGVVLRSTDGGATWVLKHQIGQANIMGAYFSDTLTGWITVLGSSLRKTTDAGATWTSQVFAPAGWLTGIGFSDAQHGWFVGIFGGSTSNGGQTWNTFQPEYDGLHDVFFVDSRHGWMVGYNGTILHTSTGGITPTLKTLVSSPTFSIYPNPAEGYITLQTNAPILSVVVMDALGRIVGAENFLPLPGNRLQISSLTPGLYWVKIKTAEGIKTQRLVKE